MVRKLLRTLAVLSYVAFLAAVFFATAYLSFNGFVRSGVTAVPKVAGLGAEEATNALREKGLRVRRSDDGQYDDSVPVGKVARQRPDAPTLVKRGSAVEIVLSLGPQRVQVPVLTGKALPAAQFTAAAVGLTLGRALAVYGEESRSAAGSVVHQDPAAGQDVSPTTPIDLLVTLPNLNDRYVMPDLIYRDYERIRPSFERSGFRLGSVKFEPYEGVASGVILRQFPLAGHPVSKEDAISLVVATAERVP